MTSRPGLGSSPTDPGKTPLFRSRPGFIPGRLLHCPFMCRGLPHSPDLPFPTSRKDASPHGSEARHCIINLTQNQRFNAMKGFKNILAAVDLSACSQRALALAIDFAFAEGTQLHVLFVEVLHGEPYDESVKKRLQAMVKARLNERGLVGLDVEYAMERDYVAGPAILRYARDHNMDLIVMGTHGRRGLRALVLGSVAAEVVREAPCAVLTVRKDGDVGSVKVRRILVPFDFSDYSREALRTALDVARSTGAKIDLIHVVEDRFHPAFYGPFFQSVYDMEPDIEQRSVRHLREEVVRLDGDDLVTSIHAFGGYPARDIPRYAERHEIDLIVMSTHGLTGMEHFLMGSVAEKTVSDASCPVLIVKPLGMAKNSSEADVGAAQVL